MRRLNGFVAIVLMSLGLGGCFASRQPLISAAQATFPFKKIIFVDLGSSSASKTVLIRSGDVYMSSDKLRYRFLHVKDNFYVAQMQLADKSNPLRYLYGLVKVDLKAKKADLFASNAKKGESAPGLTACGDQESPEFCLTELQPYIDHAMVIANSGDEPDNHFKIISAR